MMGLAFKIHGLIITTKFSFQLEPQMRNHVEILREMYKRIESILCSFPNSEVESGNK